MADDPTPTPNSDQTPNPNPAPSDPPADPAPAAPAADPAPEPKRDEGDDLGATALGGGDEPKADDPPAEAKPVVPETYDLKPPEGFEKLDEQAVAAATPVFKELGLSNEQAQKLIPVVGEYAKRIVAERDTQLLGTIMEQRKDWLETAKADPEIGGQQWDATMQGAARALDRLGFPKGSPLRVALDESGFGNHPEMIRFAAKVGKAIGEDPEFVRGDGAVKSKQSPEAILYPNDIPQGAK